MKLERISMNKIKYSITFEELSGRGFIQEEMLDESFVWDELFDEMLDEASKEYQLETYDAVSIEIFSLTSKELVLILTLDEEDIVDENEPKLEDCIDQKCLLFRFDDIEGGILLAKALQNLSLGDVMSSLYYFKKGYYLLLDQSCIKNDGLMSLCEEYGVLSTVSPFYIIEYGKLIVKDEAIETLQKYF